MKPKKKNQPVSLKRFLAKGFLYLIGSIIIFVGLLVSLVKLGAFGAIPDKQALENIKNPQGSIVLDRNEKRIGQYYLVNRRSVDIEKLPTCLINALVATEDARFYKHDGVDYKSFFRVFFKTVLLQKESGGGGSTITQQLSKNLYPRKRYVFLSLVINKVREMVIAGRVEEAYEKKEILQLYLNTVPFGENVFGIEAASRLFFSKGAENLACHEAATLVGMLKANTYYNPRLHPERALKRRNLVLTLTRDRGYLNESEYKGFEAQTLGLKYGKNDEKEKLGEYFQDQVLKQAKKIISEINKKDDKTYDVYTAGLKVFTTLDAGMQKYAEAAMGEWMPVLQKEFNDQWKSDPLLGDSAPLMKSLIRKSSFYQEWKAEGLSGQDMDKELQRLVNMEVFDWKGSGIKKIKPIDFIREQAKLLSMGMVAMDPQTGEVLAWVGGIDHKFFKYDHVGNRPGRQVGSTFKPIVYATALENGVSPCQYYKAQQETYVVDEKEWTPGNSGGEYDGKYSMEGALTESVNTVAVKVIEETGIGNVIIKAQELGIASDLPKVPSLALGTASIPLLEMATAYGALANKGKANDPLLITKIEDNQGNVIWQNEQIESRQALEENTAMLISDMLQNVVDEGTGSALRSRYLLDIELAGKTGTTQNNVDGWFMGFTPKLVVGVWVGNDNPSLHFKTTALGQGAHTALPIFGKFMVKLDKDRKYHKYSKAEFDPLPRNLERKLNCDPFREEFKLFQWLFKKKKNRKEKGSGKKKKGFLKKIFNK